MNKIVLLVGVAFACTVLACAPALAVTVDSAQGARTAATRLAQQMGWAYGSPSAADLKELPGHGKLWRVEFSGAALMHLNPATGEMVSATDLSRQALVDSSPAPTKAAILSVEQAGKAVTRLLDLIGTPEEARFLKTELSADNREWRFVWVRTFHGIDYRDDVMAVGVSAQEGELLGFGRTFLCAPPTEATVTVTEAEALTFADEVASSLGLSASDTASAVAELRVVQPNNYWGPDPPVEDNWGAGAASRVAWLVKADRGQEFWIDAADGSLLGGTQPMGSGFVERRLSKKMTMARAPASHLVPVSWPLAGAVLPLVALLFFLGRRVRRVRVQV